MAREGSPCPQMMGAAIVDVGGVGGSHRSSWSGSSWATWTRDSLREHKSTLFWYHYNLQKLLMWATLISWISFSNWLNISWPIGNWLGIGFLSSWGDIPWPWQSWHKLGQASEESLRHGGSPSGWRRIILLSLIAVILLCDLRVLHGLLIPTVSEGDGGPPHFSVNILLEFEKKCRTKKQF